MAELVQGNVKVAVVISGSFVDVPGVTNASYSGAAPRETDATDFDTPEFESETLYGARPNTPLTFQMHLQPGDATQEVLFAAHYANTEITVRLLAKTRGTSFVGRCVIGESHSIDGKMTADVSILPFRAPTREVS